MPQSALPCHTGRLVQISHYIDVTVHTRACATNVEVGSSIPLYTTYYDIPLAPMPYPSAPAAPMPVLYPSAPEAQQYTAQPTLRPVYDQAAPMYVVAEALPDDWAVGHKVTRADPVSIQASTVPLQY